MLVGENAETYKLGMVESQWPEDAIEIFADSASAKDSVAAFKGSVFAKGSRVCELENALPAAALAALDSEGARRIEPEPEPEEPEPPERRMTTRARTNLKTRKISKTAKIPTSKARTETKTTKTKGRPSNALRPRRF